LLGKVIGGLRVQVAVKGGAEEVDVVAVAVEDAEDKVIL